MKHRSIYLFIIALLLPVVVRSYELVGSLYGEVQGDQYGSAFCTIDFNNDGFQDLAVSAPASDAAGISSGKVYIYYGGLEADTVADLTLVGAASSFFGKSLSSAGDFNNDGAEDLLVGAPFYDQPADNAGAVYLFYGGSSPDGTVDHVFTGEATLDYFGIAVAGGDFNNDGVSDIVVGAYKADWGEFVDPGKVYVYYGATAPDFDVDRMLVGDANGERFGYSLALGDFSGDGAVDISVGAYSYDGAFLNQGRIYVFFGSDSPDVLHDLVIQGQGAGDKYGWSLAGGKVTGDSYSDIIMGTDGYEVSGFSAGRVYVFGGGPGLDDIPDFTYDLGLPAEDLLGFSVSSGGDVDCDGNDDFLVGMPGNSQNASSSGGAIIFTGGSPIVADTTVLGETIDEQIGHAVFLWSHFGGNSVGFGAGGIGYDNFRGRVVLFKSICSADCCEGRVGDANGLGGDEPTIGDVSVIIDAKFITGICNGIIVCLQESDINQSGGCEPTCDDITIGDVSILIDYLFITGPDLGMPDCLPCN